MSNLWKTLSSKIVYKNPFFTVYEDLYKKPDGALHKYHFLKKAPFVAIIPIASRDEIYLVRQFRYPIQDYTWEIPEGYVAQGESLLHAAKRELAEEANFEARSWKALGFAHLAVGHTNQEFFIFSAENLKKIQREGLENIDEIEKVKKFNLAQINEMIVKNKITESATIVSLYKYQQAQGRKL